MEDGAKERFQRITEAYSAGYEDGQGKSIDNMSNWLKS